MEGHTRRVEKGGGANGRGGAERATCTAWDAAWRCIHLDRNTVDGCSSSYHHPNHTVASFSIIMAVMVVSGCVHVQWTC